MEHVAALLPSYFSRYGYWTIAFALLLENAGVPMPGETVLLLASFLASSQHQLPLPYIILVGTLAATAGDNIGCALGCWGGPWLLDRYRRCSVPNRICRASPGGRGRCRGRATLARSSVSRFTDSNCEIRFGPARAFNRLAAGSGVPA